MNWTIQITKVSALQYLDRGVGIDHTEHTDHTDHTDHMSEV